MTLSPKTLTINPTASDLETLKVIWQDIRQHLAQRKEQLYGELKHYPTPIARCDEHFTHLIEQRARVFQAMSRMDMTSHGNLTADDYVALIQEFIASPIDVSDATEQAIRRRSQMQLAEQCR